MQRVIPSISQLLNEQIKLEQVFRLAFVSLLLTRTLFHRQQRKLILIQLSVPDMLQGSFELFIVGLHDHQIIIMGLEQRFDFLKNNS
jgi:hypothetical protein